MAALPSESGHTLIETVVQRDRATLIVVLVLVLVLCWAWIVAIRDDCGDSEKMYVKITNRPA